MCLSVKLRCVSLSGNLQGEMQHVTETQPNISTLEPNKDEQTQQTDGHGENMMMEKKKKNKKKKKKNKSKDNDGKKHEGGNGSNGIERKKESKSKDEKKEARRIKKKKRKTTTTTTGNEDTGMKECLTSMDAGIVSQDLESPGN